MRRGQQTFLVALSGNERLNTAIFQQSVVSFECFLHIIVDQEARRQHIIVCHIPYQAHQCELGLSQLLDQMLQLRVVSIGCMRLVVNNLVRQVYVALDKVHVLEKRCVL